MKKPIVIKVGTNVITGERGQLDLGAIKDLAQQIATLKKQGVPVVLVTSGAVAAGRSLFKLIAKPEPITERQVFAAVGQVPLMGTYEKYFSKYGLQAAQVLATREDFRDRDHYLNMRRCFTALLENNVMPVVNENDVVAAAELMFTDNDELSGLVAGILNAEALFLLTSVDGILDDAGITIPLVHKNVYFKQYLRPDKTSFGRGGMTAKCSVAERIANLGITTYIINGTRPQSILQTLKGEVRGTKFLAAEKQPAIKKWLAQSRGIEQGAVTITTEAERALKNTERVTSLLPVGIMSLEGEFKKGDIVQIKNMQGRLFGYGRAEYGAAELQPRLRQKNQPEFIHYDYLYRAV